MHQPVIHKSELPGKFVEYRDRHGKTRIGKVKTLQGNTLTIIDALKARHQVRSDNVLSNIHHGHCRRTIDWSIKRKKKGGKN